MQFANDRSRQRRSLIARPELGLENHLPSKDGESIRSDLDLFGLRVGHRFNDQRTRRPGELKRNQKFVFGLVAVHVKSRLNGDGQLVRNLFASLYRYLRRRLNGDPLRLRPGEDCQG